MTRRRKSRLLALAAAMGLTTSALAAGAMPYTDVTEKNWHYDAVSFVTEKQLMDGLTETTFGPGESMTRQMLAEALYRLAGSPAVTAENPFTDVAAGASYRDAVVWAYSEGVVNGLTATTFGPDNTIERQAIAAMLARYLDADTTGEGDLSAFSDAGSVRSYAKGALSWAVSNELIQGNPDGTVDPRGSATRAQVAAILQRFVPMTEGGTAASDITDPEQKKLQDSADEYVAKQDYEKAAECYRQMLAGKYISEDELGEKLYNVAYEASQKEAYDVSAKLLQEAAGQGSVTAANELGNSYLKGRGVETDEKKALELYQEAAAKGMPSAMYNVGVCYAYGYGTETDEAAAFEWFQKAANAGSPAGMFATGAWYAVGTGVEADKEQAVSWLEKYIASGNTLWTDNAQGLLEELKAE